MPKARCPHCDTPVTYPDEKAGKRVWCGGCDDSFLAPAPAADRERDEDDDRPARRPSRRDRGANERRKQARRSDMATAVAACVVLGAFVVVVGVVAVVTLLRKSEPAASAPAPGWQPTPAPAWPTPQPAEGQETPIQGGPFDPPVRDAGPPGSLLVGFEAGIGTFVNYDVVHGVRGVYRLDGRDEPGEPRGKAWDRTARVVAKPGYAVGAITTKTGLGLDGFGATFMRVLPDGRLDPADSYESEWLGGKNGGGPTRVGGDGRPAVGVACKVGREGQVSGIGLIYDRAAAGK